MQKQEGKLKSYRKNRYALVNLYSLILGLAFLALAFMLVVEG